MEGKKGQEKRREPNLHPFVLGTGRARDSSPAIMVSICLLLAWGIRAFPEAVLEFRGWTRGWGLVWGQGVGGFVLV